MKQLNPKPFLFWWALSILAGLSTWAIADRRPAVVVAMEQEKECSAQITRLDSQRFEAEKEVARLRGALRHMQSTMQRVHAQSADEGCMYKKGTPVQDSIYFGDLYRTAESALAEPQMPKQAAQAH